MQLIIQASLALHFYRLGRKWTKEGVIVDIAEFAEEQWDVLKNEVNLRIREATEAEIAALAAPQITPGDKDVIDALMAAIPTLPDAEFTKSGQPRLGALRKAVEIDPALVTEKRTKAAMLLLVSGGFKSPVVEE